MAVIHCPPLVPQVLDEIARSLRPELKSFVPVLKIAHGLGVQVRLRFDQAANAPVIKLNDKPPTIRLTRKAPVSGHRILSVDDEHILTTRERFSIAHELGHFLAFERFNILPAQDRSGYWTQEAWMHSFAGTLLTSENTIQECLHGLPDCEPVSPFVLRNASLKTARISQEVVATQLCKKRPDVGFMKLLATQSKRTNRKVLAVAFAVSGTGIFLPKNHAHIDNPILFEKLQNHEYGQIGLDASTLGKLPTLKLRVSWLRAGNLVQSERRKADPQPVPAFWLSLVLDSSLDQPQLTLW